MIRLAVPTLIYWPKEEYAHTLLLHPSITSERQYDIFALIDPLAQTKGNL